MKVKKTPIQEIISTNNRDTVNNLIQQKQVESFVKHFIGKVEDNKDPDQLGRCKIRVFGVFDESIGTNDLPWALPESSFVGSKIGSFITPTIGTVVRVYFDQNNLYTPIYTTKVVDTSNPATRKDEDYPDTMVMFETDEGEYHIINRKQSTTEYHCANGLYFQSDADGNLLIDAKECNSGEIRISDKNGNILEMTSDGLTYNGSRLVTENFVNDMLNKFGAAFTLTTAPGTPSPINPPTLSAMKLNLEVPADQNGYFSKGKVA